jgi:hypothetical protein
MCFSASASFVASAALLTGGVATLKQTRNVRQIPFASIPMLFGVQQLMEGFLWLSMMHTDFSVFRTPTTYMFLIFAQVVWPSLVPFSIYLLETDPKRKKILLVLLGIGAIISLYIAFSMLFYPVEAAISSHHIAYYTDFPHQRGIVSSLLYLLPTVVPPFMSSLRKMNILGSIILISLIISKVYFPANLVSVWCYFAAIISVTVYFIIKELRDKYYKDITVYA